MFIVFFKVYLLCMLKFLFPYFFVFCIFLPWMLICLYFCIYLTSLWCLLVSCVLLCVQYLMIVLLGLVILNGLWAYVVLCFHIIVVEARSGFRVWNGDLGVALGFLQLHHVKWVWLTLDLGSGRSFGDLILLLDFLFSIFVRLIHMYHHWLLTRVVKTSSKSVNCSGSPTKYMDTSSKFKCLFRLWTILVGSRGLQTRANSKRTRLRALMKLLKWNNFVLFSHCDFKKMGW